MISWKYAKCTSLTIKRTAKDEAAHVGVRGVSSSP